MENLEVGWWEFKVGKGLGREGFEGDERERRVEMDLKGKTYKFHPVFKT